MRSFFREIFEQILFKNEKSEVRKAVFDLYTQLNLGYPSVTHRVIHNRVNMPIRLIKKRIYETICKLFLYKI